MSVPPGTTVSRVGKCASELPGLLVPLLSLHFYHLQACPLEIPPGISTRVSGIPQFPIPPAPTLHTGHPWLHQAEPCGCAACRGSTSIPQPPDLGQRQVLGGILLSLKRTLNARNDIHLSLCGPLYISVCCSTSAPVYTGFLLPTTLHLSICQSQHPPARTQRPQCGDVGAIFR